MLPSVTEEKAALRRTVRRWLAALPSSERRESDRALFAHFLSLPQVEGAKTIFAFWGIPEREPDTGELVRQLAERGKVVGLPRMLPGRGMEVRGYASDRPLVPAAFGLLEPDEQAPLLERAAIDLILVPAVCYDKAGYRLGFGGGYYDRWLEHFNGFRVGMCRNAVLQDKVPTEPHDSRVDLLLTETESIVCG